MLDSEEHIDCTRVGIISTNHVKSVLSERLINLT